MYPADESTYMAALRKWRRAEPCQRIDRMTRETKGRAVRELLSYGVVRVRIVDEGGGIGAVYTETGRRFLEPDPGKISFHTWMPLEMIYGTAKRVKPRRND